MNVIDYVILGVIGISLIFGLYRGFLSSVLTTAGTLLSFVLSFVLSPRMAQLIQENGELRRSLLTYFDASSLIGDKTLGTTPVTSLNGDAISELVARIQLPAPLGDFVQKAMDGHIYPQYANVNEYVSETILTACVNVICFVICFVVLCLACTIIINLLDSIMHFPVLKQLNALAGGAFGILRGILICFVLLTVIPLIMTVVPIDFVSDLINESVLAPYFTNGTLVEAIMNGRLPL